MEEQCTPQQRVTLYLLTLFCTNTPSISYPAGTIPNHHSDIPKHTRGVLHEGRVVQAALQVAGSHQRTVTQVAPQQASLQLPLAHDLLPRTDSSRTLAAQGHNVDGPVSQKTLGWMEVA